MTKCEEKALLRNTIASLQARLDVLESEDQPTHDHHRHRGHTDVFEDGQRVPYEAIEDQPQAYQQPRLTFKELNARHREFYG